MDKPRSWIPIILPPPDLIIEAPQSLPLWVRTRDWVLTTVVWVAYLWLISDTFNYVRYLFDRASERTLQPEDVARFAGIFATLESYGLVIALNAAILIGWALYNRTRFRGRERRKFSSAVTLQDLSRLYEAPVSDVAAWQIARILVMHHDDTGRLVAVDIKAKPQLGAAAKLTAAKVN